MLFIVLMRPPNFADLVSRETSYRILGDIALGHHRGLDNVGKYIPTNVAAIHTITAIPSP